MSFDANSTQTATITASGIRYRPLCLETERISLARQRTSMFVCWYCVILVLYRQTPTRNLLVLSDHVGDPINSNKVQLPFGSLHFWTDKVQMGILIGPTAIVWGQKAARVSIFVQEENRYFHL